MFRRQPTLRRIATSRDQQTHAVVCCDQREARHACVWKLKWRRRGLRIGLTRDSEHRPIRHRGDVAACVVVLGDSQTVGLPLENPFSSGLRVAVVTKSHPVGHDRRENVRTLIVGQWHADRLVVDGFGSVGRRDSSRQTLVPQRHTLCSSRPHDGTRVPEGNPRR